MWWPCPCPVRRGRPNRAWRLTRRGEVVTRWGGGGCGRGGGGREEDAGRGCPATADASGRRDWQLPGSCSRPPASPPPGGPPDLRRHPQPRVWAGHAAHAAVGALPALPATCSVRPCQQRKLNAPLTSDAPLPRGAAAPTGAAPLAAAALLISQPRGVAPCQPVLPSWLLPPCRAVWGQALGNLLTMQDPRKPFVKVRPPSSGRRAGQGGVGMKGRGGAVMLHCCCRSPLSRSGRPAPGCQSTRAREGRTGQL